MEIDRDRLRGDLEENARFGAVSGVEGHGRTVLTGSEADRLARERFVSRLEDAGLDVRVDAVGNVAGRWVPEGVDPDRRAVATGSHLDSVPEGGIFDGPLGVYGGLEAVRALRESGRELARPIDVVSFTEEEGQRFGDGMLGSLVATDRLDRSEALSLTAEGVRLESALESIGFRGDDRIDPAAWAGWLELHPEQGTILEDRGATVGVVTTITGITHLAVEVTGEANHAGATPMGERTDALVAASEIVGAVEASAARVVETTSASAVGTVGSVEVSPNATNVVPGAVRLGIDVRDVEEASIETIVSDIETVAGRLERERGVEVSIERPAAIPPEAMSEHCREAAFEAGEALGVETHSMFSGAAHDTMTVARVTDAGLLFAPSRDGISHNPREWTEWADCERATAVLADALARLAA